MDDTIKIDSMEHSRRVIRLLFEKMTSKTIILMCYSHQENFQKYLYQIKRRIQRNAVYVVQTLKYSLEDDSMYLNYIFLPIRPKTEVQRVTLLFPARTLRPLRMISPSVGDVENTSWLTQNHIFSVIFSSIAFVWRHCTLLH